MAPGELVEVIRAAGPSPFPLVHQLLELDTESLETAWPGETHVKPGEGVRARRQQAARAVPATSFSGFRLASRAAGVAPTSSSSRISWPDGLAGWSGPGLNLQAGRGKVSKDAHRPDPPGDAAAQKASGLPPVKNSSLAHFPHNG